MPAQPDADDEMVMIDPDQLTLGEVEDFEQAAGQSIGTILGGQLNGKALVALVWVMKRRDNAAYTLEDARKVRLGQFSRTSAPDPPNAADG